MRQALSIGLALAVALPLLVGQEKHPPTAQIQRGHDLFMKAANRVACATCHRMAGEGTAIGPDLTTMGSQGTPHVIVMTMRMTMTNYVQSFKTDSGKFPGMLKEKRADDSDVWDLSQMPPVVRTLPTKQVMAADRDQTWKHPPSTVEYTPQELADLIGFLRWAATGTDKDVKTADVADLK